LLIKRSINPSEEIKKELKEVERICKAHDMLNSNLFLDTSMNFNPNINSVFLIYEGDQLVSFVSMFIPTQEDAEISAYTLPEYRQRGYFKKLLIEAMTEARKYNIRYLLL